MGEYAEYFLEDVMEMESARLDYRLGDMAQEEAYERGIIDEMGFEENPDPF